MSLQYDLYLDEHKGNVAKGYKWLKEHLPELVPDGLGLEHQICYAHDASKTDQEEYEAYDRYFYGNNKSYDVVQDFNYAWLRHIHHNPHHYQHWTLNNDDPELGEIIMVMPYAYIVEMICDWWSFSWSKGNLREIFKWWDEHCNYMKLSANTRKTVLQILAQIEIKIDELERESRDNE